MARKLLDDLQLPGTLCDQDGCIEALYHLLWARNINGEPCLDLLVPDVVIYKHITLCRNQLAQPSASWCHEGFPWALQLTPQDAQATGGASLGHSLGHSLGKIKAG